MPDVRAAKLVPDGKAPALAVAGDVYLILATGDDTGGACCLFDAFVPPGGGPPPHRQSREGEMFYVLEGAFTFHLGDETHRLGPGGFVNVPRGTTHFFRGDGPGVGRMPILNASAGIEKFFLAVGRPVADRNAKAPPLSAEEVERMKALAADYGVELL